MALPQLAPRRSRTTKSILGLSQSLPTHDEWAALYPELECLYVHERRKLRYVMQYMSKQYGFKATMQMYKKRFAKWGFQKNSRKCAPARQSSADEIRILDVETLSPIPSLSHNDTLILTLLSNVRNCSVAFFESANSSGHILPSCWHKETHEVSFTFKLISGLLDRGHGKLAGRLARKAFLLIEDMLTAASPALFWNLLDLFQHMLTMHQPKLFGMLLVHLLGLIDRLHPAGHPLLIMLHSLRKLSTSFIALAPNSPSGSHTPMWSSASPSSDSAAGSESNALSDALSFTLEQAWTLNAEVLFNNFDDRLFHLYCRIHWESCSFVPPAAIVVAAERWLSHAKAQKQIGQCYGKAPLGEDSILGHLLVPRDDVSPPQDYQRLRLSSMSAIRKHVDITLSEGVSDRTVLLRSLAGLVTAKIFEEWPGNLGQPVKASDDLNVSRDHASHVACAVKTLMLLGPESKSDAFGVSQDTIERLRAVVALREHARGEADPQVVHEMWLLRDALLTAGSSTEALELEAKADERLKQYISDIPVDFVR